MRKKVVSFKMDTGAEVTAINPDTYHRLGSPPLTKSTKVLYGPSCHVLLVQGHFSVFLRHGSRSTRQRVYVIDGLKRNLLGLPSMINLQLVSRVNTTESEEHKITKQFPQAFKGLGTIGDAYTIKLKE